MPFFPALFVLSDPWVRAHGGNYRTSAEPLCHHRALTHNLIRGNLPASYCPGSKWKRPATEYCCSNSIAALDDSSAWTQRGHVAHLSEALVPLLLQHKRGCCRAEMLFDHHVDFGRTPGRSKCIKAITKAVWKIFNANGWENKIDFQ